MKGETRNDVKDVRPIESLEKLVAQRQRWARFSRGLMCGLVVALAGLAWAVKDWFNPDVNTSDTWALPLSIVFSVEMAGLLAFSRQEWKKAGRRLEQAREVE